MARHARDSLASKEMAEREATRQAEARAQQNEMTRAVLEIATRAPAQPANGGFREGFDLAHSFWSRMAEQPSVSEADQTMNTIGQSIEMMAKAKELLNDAPPKSALPAPPGALIEPSDGGAPAQNNAAA